ncbi:MAG: hypothetical protein COU65_03195 [Candidatus Pacebacteria bacterium CG10_big_fil_rev_8_21_14_0_10_42_12]|nr:MAG: hypothetical protein COU65_03195 [Candidatus Pacebacteria bacterium CG10_big_fil_rev_8_21_14_0_10_42_12]
MWYQKIKTVARLTLIVSVVLLFAQATDADLLDREQIGPNIVRASTLDFANLDTANETGKSLLFSIQGLVPTGFQVESVRIRNEGELAFQYSISAVKTAGDDAFCSALKMRVFSNWTTKYDSNLLALSYVADMAEGDTQDLVFSLGLDDSSESLIGQNCAFNLVINTIQETQNGTMRFYDQEVLQSQVTAGVWTIGS